MTLQEGGSSPLELALEMKPVCRPSTWRSHFILKCDDSLKWEIINSLSQIVDSQRKASWPLLCLSYRHLGSRFSFQATIEVLRTSCFLSNWTLFLVWASVLPSCWKWNPSQFMVLPLAVFGVVPSSMGPHRTQAWSWRGCLYFVVTCLWWYLWRHPCSYLLLILSMRG